MQSMTTPYTIPSIYQYPGTSTASAITIPSAIQQLAHQQYMNTQYINTPSAAQSVINFINELLKISY